VRQAGVKLIVARAGAFLGACRFRTGIGTQAALPAFFAWLICGAIVAVSSIVLILSFLQDFPMSSALGIQNYVDAMDRYLFAEVLPNTVLVGIGTVGVVLFFSVPLAWLLTRTNVPLRTTWISLLAVSVVVPAYLKAMGWIMLINPKMGLLNKLLADLLGIPDIPLDVASLWGISFIQGLMLTPVMFFLLAGPMRSIDPALEEAAIVAGASAWKRFWRINMRLLWPATLGGMIYTMMSAISIFDAAAMLGGFDKNPVLATAMFLRVEAGGGGEIPNYGVAGVYGLLLTGPSLVALYFYFQVIKQQHRYAVIGGRGYRPATVDLGRFKVLGLAFILTYLTLAVFFPFLMLLWQSFLPYLQFPSRHAFATMSFIQYLNAGSVASKGSILNTATLVLFATVLTLFFGFMVSWIVTRTRLLGRQVLDSISMLPHAIPGLAFAFALLVVAIMARKYAPWLPLYGTVLVLVIAHVMNRISYVTRVANAALLQVSSELEEAALICGAKRLVAIFRILIPLVGPALLFAGLWTAIIVFRDLTIALMLWGPKNAVISVLVWQAWRSGNYTLAAATGVIMVVLLGTLVFAAQKIGRLERLYVD